MKGIIFILFTVLSYAAYAQYVGAGYQYADFRHHQFVATAAFPWEIPSDGTFLFLSSGLEYSTKGAPVSGLNLRTLSASIPIVAERKSTWFIFQPGLDCGYLFGLNQAKDGVVVTPNFHIEYTGFFHLRTGYDYNVTEKQGQFFIRLAVGIGAGGAMLWKGFTRPRPYLRH
jgi:hypothetical protein